MAQSDLLKRYLDAGIAFTQMTRERAEEIVRDLVKAGEVQSDQAQQAVQDLFDRSRENTDRLVELVRKEIREQVSTLGLVTQDEVAKLRKRIDSLTGQRGGSGSGGGSAPTAPAAPAAPAASPARPTAKPVKTATPTPARDEPMPAVKKATAKKAAAGKKAAPAPSAKKAAPAKKTAAKKS